MSTLPGEPLPCPVCAATCVPLGAVDFNKCCAEVRGTQLPPSGRLVHYILCTACGFCWAPEFSTWKSLNTTRPHWDAGGVPIGVSNV